MIWLMFIATLAVLCALATNSRPLLITTTACLLGALLGILAAIVVSGLQQVNCCRIPLRHGCIVLPLSCCVSSPSPQMHTAGPLFPRFSSRLALCSCQFYYSYTPSEGLLCQAWWTATGHTSVRRISVLANNRCRLVYGVVAMVTITCSAGSFCSWRVSYCPCTRSGPPFLDSTHPVCIVLCCVGLNLPCIPSFFPPPPLLPSPPSPFPSGTSWISSHSLPSTKLFMLTAAAIASTFRAKMVSDTLLQP